MRARHPHLKFIAPGTDIYPVVKHASVFMTDYSSLAFDVLHINCPLVFYRPDHEDYGYMRGRLFLAASYTPGDVVTDVAGLARAVDAAVELSAHAPEKDGFREARHALRKKLFDHHDGLASQRLGDLILNDRTRGDGKL